MTDKEILLRRLHNQGLLGGGGVRGAPDAAEKRHGTIEDLVRWMGCIQAQDFGQAKWAIGVRGRAVTEANVDAAFNDGRILRTHVLRPTWHFVLPTDIRWMLRLTAPRIRQFCQPYHRKMGIDAAVLRRSRKVLEKELGGGVPLTRVEIAQLFRRSRINTDDIRMNFLLIDAELEGLICSGPRRGKQFTYTLLEERAQGAGLLPPDEALAELAVRYFRSRGPATLADLAWWSGLTITQAKRGLEMVKGRLELVVVDGEEYWVEDPPGRGGAGGGVAKEGHAGARSLGGGAIAPPVLLLPAFDEYLVAYKDRAHVLPSEYAKESSYGLKPVVVVNGRVAGCWERVVEKDMVAVEVKAFGGLSKKVWAAVKKEARRYAVFAGGELAFFPGSR